MKKKYLSVLLCLSLSFGLSIPTLAAETGFADVPAGSWLEEGALTCAQEGIMVGTEEGRFSPDTNLTAAECLTLALRLYDLQRGGDGSMETAPEDWGKVTLTLADGTIFTRYGEQNSFFSKGHFDPYEDGQGVYPAYILALGDTTEEREAWAKAHEGPATLTAEGKTYSGSLVADSNYDGPLLRFASEEIPNSGSLLSNTQPGPDRWYRNAVYTAKAWDLTDADGFSSLLGYLSYGSPDRAQVDRDSFARALASAAGSLEKKYDVPHIPDVERNEYHENLYMLYEAGILSGMDSFGTFYGRKYLTRAEAAVMVARVLEPAQRLPSPPAQPNAYDQAVIDLRTGFTYYDRSERTYETEDCTIFVYDRGGAMHTGDGNITILYKPGSQPGAGAGISEESPANWATYQDGVDLFRLSEDRNTLTYGYHIEKPVMDIEDKVVCQPGIYTYTVDLPTATTTPGYAPLSYSGAVELLEYGRNYTLEKRLDTGRYTVLLRWKPTDWQHSDIRDYELWLVRREEAETMERLLLPSTTLVYDGYSKPTDRAPDSLFFSDDGKTLCYTYSFDAPLIMGDTVYHAAGSYTYTVDLSTGELTVAHTAN